MNYVEYLLLNLTTQLDNISLAQPVTKQCFMLFSVCVCVKRALAITENTLQQNMVRSGSQMFVFAHCMKKFWVCHSLLYFALLTYISEL